jgi:hypothetical protein
MGKTWEQQGDQYYDAIVPRGRELFHLVDEDFGELGKVITELDRCDFKELELHVHLFRKSDDRCDWEASKNRWIGNL